MAVIAALEAVDVASRHEGTLLEVLVRPGDPLKQGDVLARLDAQPMREALAVARAERRSAATTVAQREVDIEQFKRDLAVEQELVAGGVGARQKLEGAAFAVTKARKSRDFARSQLAEQDARIDQLERRLAEAAITAPFAGTVSLRYRDPGALVQPGAPIARLIRTDSMWVKFAAPPDHAASFRVGQPVAVELESSATELPATIRHISPELDPAARMIFIEAELAVPDDLRGALRAGIPAWVTRAPNEPVTPGG